MKLNSTFPWLALLMLSPDEVGGSVATETPVAVDPLATPVGDIDISRPVARAANYEMAISKAAVDDNKAKTGKNLVITWHNTKELQSTKNEAMQPKALTLSEYIPLQATEKMSLQDIAKRIARTAKAVGLPAEITPRDIVNNPSVLVGKIAIVKVGIKQETAEFPEGNEVKGVVIEG